MLLQILDLIFLKQAVTIIPGLKKIKKISRVIVDFQTDVQSV